MDMGSDDYGLKNYFTQSLKFRYGYYRKSTAGHNTLTFDNDGLDNTNRGACDQDPGPDGITSITLFAGSDSIQDTVTTPESDSSPAFSIVDLTAAYGRQNSSRVERGFAFTESYEHLLIVDEFEFAPTSTVRNVTWTMHTMAAIQLPTADSGNGENGFAVLSLGGVSLHVKVIEPHGAVFSAADVDLLPPQKPSVGVSKLQVHLDLGGNSGAGVSVTRIVVGLSLSAGAATVTPNPLAQWKAAGPFAVHT